jgi:uncharacterized protein
MQVSRARPDPSLIHRDLLAFLSNPASYPHQPRHVRVIQTHASYVAIVPPYVYKVKKPVDFGFLDFTTLEKRRSFCHREVELNRRLCQRTYLGVVPISWVDGYLTFGPGTEVVEYAVKMRKLADRYFLDRLLARNLVGPAEVTRLATTLVAFYQAQRPTAEAALWGDIEKIRVSTTENFHQTANFVGATISRAAFAAIKAYTDGFFDCHPNLFASRARDGWIRDCHGDLHAEHVHLAPRSICIYDCIEFNDRFRYVDIASDIAFLAMDLDYRGRPDLADFIVAWMARALGDPAMECIVNFYKCYRAYVRGKVESLRSIEDEVPDEERWQSHEAARRYFRLALQYAVSGNEPTVIVVMGRIASGKSTLAMQLSEELGWEVIGSDRMRKARAGIRPHGRPTDEERTQLYSPEMIEATYDALFSVAEERLRTKQCLILDATFSHRNRRERLIDLTERLGVRYYIVEALALDDERRRRLGERASRADEISDARLEDLNVLDSAYDPPVEIRPDRVVAVDTSRLILETIETTLVELARRNLESSLA